MAGRGIRALSAAVVAMGLALPGAAQGSELERVSVSSSGQQSNQAANEPSMSADGRYVAFSSFAGNLVPGDSNFRGDVFVRDRDTGETERVSIATGGGQANNLSFEPSISADGRYVAFWSRASNLVPGDTNGRDDIFVHDRETGETSLVSATPAGAPGNNTSSEPAISGNGRYVAFNSQATNLVPGGAPAGRVYLRDLETGQTRLVSGAEAGATPGFGGFASISGDGSRIVFAQVVSTSCGTFCTASHHHVYLHDRASGEYRALSRAHDGGQPDGWSGVPAISADGTWVAFASEASNLVPGDTNAAPDVFLHDLEGGENTRASVASDGTQAERGAGSTNYYSPIGLSGDGRYVAFVSGSANLVHGDTAACGHAQPGTCPDIFVRDRLAGETTRHSMLSDGTQADGHSIEPALSADGRHIAFVTAAQNLVPGGDANTWMVDVVAGDLGRFVAPHPTELSAEHALSADDRGVRAGHVRAVLVNGRNGKPVTGREVSFSAGGTAVCAAATDAEGVAQCAYGPEDVVALAAAGGYEATFRGDAVYSPSEARAPLLKLLDAELPG